MYIFFNYFSIIFKLIIMAYTTISPGKPAKPWGPSSPWGPSLPRGPVAPIWPKNF